MNGLWLLLVAGVVPEDLSIFHPASPAAASIRDLSWLVFAISGLIFAIVEGVLFYNIYRFRAGRAVAAEPPQFYGSMPIEIAWTVAPCLVVFTLGLVTTRTLWEVVPDTPQPRTADHALFVTVVGRQWWWEYQYEHYDGRELRFITADELHIPVSDADLPRPVYLTLTSADVSHSFWVPRLAGKMDLIPNHTNYLWLQTQQTGLFVGQCAEYCGTQHANMLLRVVVDEPEEFERWLAAQQQPAAEEASAADGRAAFLSQSCVNCHRVRGTPATGSYAPDLTHLMSRETLAAGMIRNTPAELYRWIDDPQSVKPGCLMPAFGLDGRQRDLIVDYLKTLR